MSALVMSDELQDLFEKLVYQVRWAESKYLEYHSLFGTSVEQIDLLNDAGAHFFGTVERVMWAELIIHISCLTGPAQTKLKNATFENLSVRRFTALVDPSVRSDVETAVKDAVAKGRFTIKPRNKLYAHIDITPINVTKVQELTLGSRRQMSEVIDALNAVVNSIALPYEGMTYRFMKGAFHGRADHVVALLRAGLAERDADHAHFMKQFIVDTTDRDAP